MGELHNYLQNILGKPVIVVMGDDKMGIIAMDTKHNYYVVNTNRCIIRTTEDSAMETFEDWKVA